MISKKELVLSHDSEVDGITYFTNVQGLIEDKGPEETIDPDMVIMIGIGSMEWARMGAPTQITVTIRPGDKMNLTGDDSFSGIRVPGATEIGDRR